MNLESNQEPATSPAHPLHGASYANLVGLIDHLTAVGAAARNAGTEVAWEDAFSLVFSANGSHQVRELLVGLGLSFDYDDPDGSYQDDVEAYLDALGTLKARLETFHSAFTA